MIAIPRAAVVACAAAAALGAFVSSGGAQENTPKQAPAATACARPNAPARVVESAPAVTPEMAEQQGIAGQVQVVVSLDANSNIVGARLFSSPSAVLNQAALAAARQSVFQTEIRDCRPLAADFVFLVNFVKKVTFATASSGERTVSVIGVGSVKRPADTALVQVQIVTNDETAAGATAKSDAVVDALKAKLGALGIGENKISSTPSLRALPTPRPGTTMPPPPPNDLRPRSGYISSRLVEITVDAVPNAGHVAAAAASLTSIDRIAIRYTLTDRAAAYRDVMSLALKDAENSARDAVTGQQQQLGVVRTVNVPIAHARPPVAIVTFHMIPVMGGVKEPDIPIPELEVRATATVTYAIKP